MMTRLKKNAVIVVLILAGCLGGGMALHAQAPAFTFECFCGYLTEADSNCDICTTSLQSRMFKGLLIYKDSVAYRWIEQPYTILQNYDALTFKELIPGAEQIRIALSGTPFDSIAQFRDSVLCPCAGGAPTVFIAGPGIIISGDTISAVDTSAVNEAWTVSDQTNYELMTNDTLFFIGTGETTVVFDSVANTVTINTPAADGSETIVTAGTGISVTGSGTVGDPYVITNTGDLSSTNELQTYAHSGTTTYTNTLSLGGGSFSITGAGINVVSQTAGAVTITGTEVDGSITNEGILGVGAGGAASSTLVSNTSGANAVTINAAGILSITESTSSNGGSITLTATEVDGSTTNELQTLSNTSDATSHTVTLSNSGGSVQLIEGSGISLTTGGTGLNGTVTVANTGDLSATNEAWTIDADDADTELITTQTVKFQGGGITVTDYIPGTDILTITSTEVDGSVTNEAWTIDATGGDTEVISNQTVLFSGAGIVTTSYSSGANTLTITGTEVDGSTTNELQTYAHGGTTSYTNTLSNGGGSFTLQSGGIVTLSHSAGTTTISATEVDGSTTNELQTLSNTSDATSHTVTLSNSGGSVKIAEGSGITIATTGTALDGIATITATDASSTNEIQSISASGAGPTSYNIDLSLSGGSVTLSEGAGINLTRSGNDITIASTITDTDDQGLTIEGSGPTYDIAIDNGTDVTIAGGGIVTLSESPANTLVITATEVDGSVTNEAWTVDADAGDTEVISNQTLLFSGAGIITTSYSAAGNTVTITGTEVDGSTTNELQTYGHSGTTSYTNTLSDGGGSFTLQSGSGIEISQTGGTVTISGAFGGAGGGGIYGDGTPGSGSDVLPVGGSNVEIPNGASPLTFDLNTDAAQYWTALKVTTPYSSDDAFSVYLAGISPVDSFRIYNYDGGTIINQSGGVLTLFGDEELSILFDSVNIANVPTRTTLPYVLGMSNTSWVNKIVGSSSGDVLKWNTGSGGYWEVGAGSGGGPTGSGTANRFAYWSGTTTLAADDDAAFDGSKVGFGTTTLTARTNINDGSAFAPFTLNAYGTSTSGGLVYAQISDLRSAGQTFLSFNDAATLTGIEAGIRHYNSGHAIFPGQMDIMTSGNDPVSITTNGTTRLTVTGTGIVHAGSTIAAGYSTTTGIHSTLQTAGSFSGPVTQGSGNVTLGASDYVRYHVLNSTVSYTLPDPTTCNGRQYIIHHFGSSGTIGLNYSVISSTGTTFNSITARQWAHIFSDGTNWIGYKLQSL